MGGILNRLLSDKFRNSGLIFVLTGLICWTFSLPLSTAQDKVRFTSIFLFTTLGGFIIHLLQNGFQFFRIPFQIYKSILPVQFFSLLPLLHLFASGDNQKELFLGIPFLVIPYIYLYSFDRFPAGFGKILLLVFVSSFLFLLICLTLKGPVYVWNSIRSANSDPNLFLLDRPQMGFITGLIYFLFVFVFRLWSKPWLLAGIFLLVLAILIWIIAKMALVAFLGINLILFVYGLRKRPFLFLSILVFASVLVFTGVYKIIDSGIIPEALSKEGLSNEKYGWYYVNSINERIALWRVSFQLLQDQGNLIAGLPSRQLTELFDQKIATYFIHLAERHFNPHNQLLYLLLHYGIFGLIFFIWFWADVFRLCRKAPFLLGMWAYFLICSQTEVYLDREFGSQIFLLMLLFSLTFLKDQQTTGNRPEA